MATASRAARAITDDKHVDQQNSRSWSSDSGIVDERAAQAGEARLTNSMNLLQRRSPERSRATCLLRADSTQLPLARQRSTFSCLIWCESSLESLSCTYDHRVLLVTPANTASSPCRPRQSKQLCRDSNVTAHHLVSVHFLLLGDKLCQCTCTTSCWVPAKQSLQMRCHL